MAFNAVTYALSKKYTDTEVAGGGAIQGKNCVISSIADIPATESKPAGQRVTFQWTLDNGTVETGTMDVYNGKDGESIDRMYVNEEGHLIVVYDNGESEDCGEITIPSSQSDWAEDDPEENSYIQHKELVYSAINDAVSAERSARQIVEAQLSAAISAISDDVSSQGTAIGAINRQLSSLIDDVGTNTSAISSINTQLSAIIDDVGTNTSAISSINHQLSAVIDDVSTNTSAISAINQDLASRADIKSIGTGLNLDSTTGELTATGGGGGTTDYPDLTNKPSINNVTLSGNKTSADLGFGTASAKDVPASGDASSTEVVLGSDSRLTDSRNAADVYSWAKASTKPTYTASEVGAVATSVVGTASGVAELDATGKVPSSQLPSYVDDVVDGYYKEADGKFYEDSAYTTEITGESGKIYVSVDTDIQYRWTGSAFSAMGGGLVLGETSSTAYRGDRGKTAYDFSQNPATASPLMDGTAAVGSSGKWAKEDHVHPSDTAKADKVASATENDLAKLDSNGNLADSGVLVSNLVTKSNTAGLIKNDGTVDPTTYAADSGVVHNTGEEEITGHKIFKTYMSTENILAHSTSVKGLTIHSGAARNILEGGMYTITADDDPAGEPKGCGLELSASYASGATKKAAIVTGYTSGGELTGDDIYITKGTSHRVTWNESGTTKDCYSIEPDYTNFTMKFDTENRKVTAGGDIEDGHGNVLNEMIWKGTTDEWSNLSAAQRAKYDGKVVILKDDAGDYTGMPQPYSFTITGSGSSVTTTFNHASITADMRVIEAIAETPSAILSDISITTANGSMTVTATVNGSSVVKVLMQPCKAEITLT